MTTRPAPRELIAPGMVAGEWWHRLADGRVQCDLCPRNCKLRAGQRGFCFVREARPEGMVLATYGRASGFCIDPIEKKPLNHFHPGSSVLSFGTAGCNLGCKFCQNWDISKASEDDRLTDWANPDAVAQAAVKAGCRSIAFTYNDPVIFAEYAIDCAIAARERGLKTVAVSAGYMNACAREDFYPHIDAANIDLKGFSEQFYHSLCFARLQPVLETLTWIHRETSVWLEVTVLLIPGQNDSESEVDQLCGWCRENLGADVPLHFTAFHPDYKLRNLPPTPPSTLRRARAQALSAGLHHVYTGNVDDPAGQSTYCPGCARPIIGRDRYVLGDWQLDTAGCCRYCGTKVAGHFDPEPGDWGGGRRRIAITN
jgi:pyruvate formate lyase activating enzyme